MMKSFWIVVLFVAVVFSAGVIGQMSEINITPRPRQIQRKEGKFVLNQKTRIVIDGEYGKRSAKILNRLLRSVYGFELKVTDKLNITSNRIHFHDSQDSEGEIPGRYVIKVHTEGVLINGDEIGQFYGIQSLIQMLPLEKSVFLTVPAIELLDRPRFPYRGMHLDVSRHFMPVEFVKKYIDLMSQYKFNYFHWHLTDDQGWRIEIKKYPRLTEIGSKRSESHLGLYSTIFKGDSVPVEGFYTQEQIKDVVAYARARYITVVPEIELPGHASAALAAYPQFGCKENYKYEIKKTWGIFQEVFCPTDATFAFLEDVLDETIKLFPNSPYIHIGGDEVLKDHWKESAFVQQLKAKENLKDEHEVQSYFIRRIEKFINSKGKRIIGWDEILEGGLAPNATVMSWRGTKGGIEAAKSKHDVIMTPTDFAYFDYGQGDPAYEPLNIGGYVPLEKVYSFDPVPKELNAEEAKYIIGGQANVWTEYLKTPSAVEYMAFPRMLALSEVLWSKPEDKNFADFSKRLDAHFPRLSKQFVNYRIPEPQGLRNTIVGADGQVTVDLKPISGATIYYTLEGMLPARKNLLYEKPISLKLQPDQKVEVKIYVVGHGVTSATYSAIYWRRDWLPALQPSGKTAGVNYSLYVPSNAYAQDTPAQNGESRSIGLQQFAQRIDPKQTFGVTFDGYINIPSDEVYDFQIDSTWNRSLSIDGHELIDEAGTKDRAIKSAVIPLKAGWHKITVHYDHGDGDMFFRVRYGIKGQGLRQIYGGELVH